MAVKQTTGFRLDPEQREQLDKLAEQMGVSVADLLRAQTAEALADADLMPKRAVSPWKWCLKDYLAFAEDLTLPEGTPFLVEDHLRLILEEVFAEGRVELLVLLPKGNYKTTLFASLACLHLVAVPNAQCYIGAADRIQADEMYRFAAHFAETHPRTVGITAVRRGTREIRSALDQGFVKVLASDDSRVGGKRQGFNPTLALIDEAHAHENANLYVDMRSGVFKRDGIILTITTAGSDPDSMLGQLRRAMLDWPGVASGLRVGAGGKVAPDPHGRLTIARSPNGNDALLEWAALPSDDLDDPAVVKLCNPASGVTIASILDAREAAGISAAMFARYRANIWSQPDDAQIERAAWSALNTGAKIPEGAEVWVIVDYARKSDTSAVVQLWRDPATEKVVPEAHVWGREIRAAGRSQPACHTLIKGERIIRQSLVREHIYAIREGGRRVLGVVYDPHLFDPEELHDADFDMIDHPQTTARMCPSSKNLYEAVNEGRIEHDGDPVLASHVTSAAAKEVGEEWRFSKARSKKPIDALICLVMGLPFAERNDGPAFYFQTEW